jgi:hypothetical protein
MRTGGTGVGERENVAAADVDDLSRGAGTGEDPAELEQCGETVVHDNLEMAEAA